MKMDALNFTMMLDNKMSHIMRHLDPHKSCFELDSPKTISGNLSFPKTVVSTMSNWMHSDSGQGQIDPDFLQMVT